MASKKGQRGGIRSGGPVWFGLLAMVCACMGVVAYGLGRERPHLILIVVDSLRADARSNSIGAARTPNLDRLAREGAVFHEAFAHTPVTLPAFTALLSARLPHEARVHADGQTVPADVDLLATHLSRRGYQTRASLALASLKPQAPGRGIDRGFERFDPGTLAVAPADDAVARARALLDPIDPRRPFFLLAHVADTHGPFDVPSDPHAESGAFVGVRDAYRRAVEESDRAVGAILDELRQRGLYERSVIVVTSNHGLSLGEHGLVGSGASLHDALLRVPLILRLPKAREDERLTRQRLRLVRQIDVAPTLLDLLGQPPLPGATGVSLLEPAERVLLAEVRPPAVPRALLALRDQTYKLVLDAGADRMNLFSLSSDPLELDDVFTHQGHLRRQWQSDLKALARP